jgi:TetR/AcrR family transcriptional repressor of nem operon
MRYPDGHKEAVRSAIVQRAAQLLRREGLAGVSIPALMKAAGLTHGGFYAHFPSREAAVAAAVEAAAAQTNAGTFAAEAGDLAQLLDSYLSLGHVHHPEGGCVLAALGSEGARQAEPVRGAFAQAARGMLRRVEAKLRPTSPAGALSEEGLRLAAQMVGAVVLARLVDDNDLAEQILSAARRPPQV